MKTLINILIFALFSDISFSQSIPDNNRIDSLKKLGRAKLIELAIKKINDPKFDASFYDRTVAKVSKTSIVIEFALSLELISNNDCFYDKVWVSLAGSGAGKGIEGNCKEPNYYKITERDQKKIDFIFESINKENEIGNIPDKKVPVGSTMKVTEKLTHYYIEMNSSSTFSHYKIEKITGNISDANHKHYAKDWDEKEEFEIIK